MLNTDFAKMSPAADNSLLWEIKPQQETSISKLLQWIEVNQASIKEKIDLYGGVIFKGFNITTAADFETIAKKINSNLSDLNPYDAIACTWSTQYTYEVTIPSIKKSLHPLSFHNEDSFLPRVPTSIMFFALEPAAEGGETLLVDSRKVYNTLPEKIKKKFFGKAIRSKLVLPEKVFLINSRTPKNKSAVEAAAKLHGAEKMTRLPNGMIQFEFITPAIIEHNDAHIWFNVIHQTSLANQCINTWWAYNCIKKGFLNKFKSYSLIVGMLIRAFFAYLSKPFSEKNEMHSYSLANGEKISLRELVQINIAYWKNVVAVTLQKGDLLLLDNRLVAHGRMPYKGKRVLLSCVGSHIETEIYNAS